MGSAVTLSAKELWEFAHRYLKELRTDYGFSATSRDGIYAALFGRDSLWMLLFLLATVPIYRRLHPTSLGFIQMVEQAGADVLTHLARHQGTRLHPATDEQPDKIPHEIRDTISDRLKATEVEFDEQGRSYSGFDQTFLFIIAYAHFRALFPDHAVVDELWSNVERSLNWIDQYADEDGDGLFEYTTRNPRNQLNQVWKDYADSVSQTELAMPPHPLAWIDVQAYAYRAFREIHDILQETQPERAGAYASRAENLQRQVHQQFWLESEQCLAIALDARKHPITLVSSNPGHALWSGIVELAWEKPLVNRLLQPDLMTRYGLRTLSSRADYYAPFAYHRGNVWPFDNAIFVMGLLQAQPPYRDEARHVIEGVSAAILHHIQAPIELYVVLDPDVFVEPPGSDSAILSLRRPQQENRNQGWTTAAMVYFAAVLAEMNGEPLIAS